MLAPKVIKCIVNMNFINFNSFYFYCQYLHPLWKGMVHIWYEKKILKGKNTMVHDRVLECFKHAQVLLKHHQFPWNLIIEILQVMKLTLRKFDKPNYYVPLVSSHGYWDILFKHCPHFLWLLWLCLHSIIGSNLGKHANDRYLLWLWKLSTKETLLYHSYKC